MSKKQKWQSGDIFLIPLFDGTCAVGQVIQKTKEALNSAVCAFFAICLKALSRPEGIEKINSEQMIALQFSSVRLSDMMNGELSKTGLLSARIHLH